MEHVVAWIEDACANFPSFSPRRQILLDAVSAHYEGKYTLSVPIFFAQLEGILRVIGALTALDDFRPTIKRDWDNHLLFGMTESAGMFNGFLARLYEGQKEDTAFNRNPILHGANVTYHTEENSLILILTILQIRTFLWFEKHTQLRRKWPYRAFAKRPQRLACSPASERAADAAAVSGQRIFHDLAGAR